MTKKNLDVYIFEQLQERMLDGTWKPGERMDVDQLADDYQVSRTPVLQALRRMENEGMIRVTRAGKFYLHTFTGPEVENIYAVFKVLEREAVRLLAARAWTAEELRAPAEELCEAAVRGDGPACCRLEAEWHRRLVAATENSCLVECFSKALGQYMAAWATGDRPRACPILADKLLELTQVLVNGDFDAAADGLEDYLNCTCRHLSEA